MTRPPHVRPVTRAARYRWRELHPQEPAWRLAVVLVGMLLTLVVACVLAPGLSS
jgi:uncharacterized iron-regulated membrane protein